MTDPFAELASDAAEVAAAHAADQAQVATDAQQHAADQATIAAQAALIAQLEAGQGTAWGSNVPHGQLPAMDSAFDGIASVRFYWPAPRGGQKAVVRFPATTDLGGALGDRIVSLSAKAQPRDVAAGLYDSDYQACFAQAPTDRKTRVAVRHEPENDGTAYTLADLHGAWDRVGKIARAAGPHIVLTPILMQYTLDPASHRDYRDWLPADYDELGFDFYPTSAAAIATMIGRMKAAAAAVGKPWFVGEVGTLGNPALLTPLAQALAAERLPVVCYFDGGNNQISNNPTARAAWLLGQQG